MLIHSSMAKKKMQEVVKEDAAGKQLLSPEVHIANLKALNDILVKNTVAHREEIHKLHSKLDSLAADHDIVDAIQRDVFRGILSSSLFDAGALATAELNALGAEKDGIVSDLDVKRKELKDLEDEFGQMLKGREIADAKCGKLEEDLKTVLFEKDLLKKFCKDDRHLVDKLVKEMDVMKSQKNVEMGNLEAENKENASKIFALNKKCLFLEENKGRLEKKVESMKRMEDAKNLVDQRNAEYEIQIGSLQAEILELEAVRKSLEDANCSCIQNIAVVQSEKNLKVDEVVALRMQLNDSIQNLEVLHKKVGHQTIENEETKKHVISLMVEKASLEKQFEVSNQGLKDVEKKLKSLDDASGQVFALLKKLTVEVMDKERTHKNCINSGFEVDKDEEMKLFLTNLESIKLAVKEKDSKIIDLNKMLDLLELSVASSNNKWGKWKWFFPATTIIFAVVSLAYGGRTLSSSFRKA